MKKSFFDMNEVGKAFLWCVILPQFLYIVFQLVLMSIGNSTGQDVNDILKITPVYILYVMLAQIAFFVIFLMFSKRTNIYKAIKFNTKFGVKNTIICVIVGIIGIFAISPIANIGSYFLSEVGYKVAEGFFFDMTSPFMLIISILLIALVPAIVEEFIFRGIIFQGLKRFGKIKATFITSALFALIHLSVEQLIYPFIFSLVLCYLVLKTNSIFASIIVHFIANTVSILMIYFKLDISFTLGLGLDILLSVCILVAGLSIIWLLAKLLKNVETPRSESEILSELENQSQIVEYNDNKYNLKVGIIIAVVLWIITFISGFM